MPLCLRIWNQVKLSASLESLLNSQSGSSVKVNTVLLALRGLTDRDAKKKGENKQRLHFGGSSSVQGTVIQQIASSFDLGC